MSSKDQLAIVQKYEVFLNYFYPIAQNIPRKHGVAKMLLIEALLAQPALFIKAGKSGHISRLYEADAGLAHLRFWLRFCSHPDRRIITLRQHQAAEVMIAEVRADTLVKARKAVEVLPHTADCKAWWDEGHDCLHRDVTAVLDAMVGSPDLADAMAANSHTIRR